MLRKFIRLALLSQVRRNPIDVISIYDAFSDLMNITTGGKLLNFGYWDDVADNPLDAQIKLTKIIGEFGRFFNSKCILDVGSGYSIPALIWLNDHPTTKILCVNLSYNQVVDGKIIPHQSHLSNLPFLRLDLISNYKDRISYINSTSTFLAIKNSTMDRVVAFESAQHFRPLKDFITEARRILVQFGMLVIAIPVLANKPSRKRTPWIEVRDLGILKITWASEHYEMEFIKSLLEGNGFEIDEIELIGPDVYQPLANYYTKNRNRLREMILSRYPNYLELLVNWSMSKMKTASEKGIIEYALLRAVKK